MANIQASTNFWEKFKNKSLSYFNAIPKKQPSSNLLSMSSSELDTVIDECFFQSRPRKRKPSVVSRLKDFFKRFVPSRKADRKGLSSDQSENEASGSYLDRCKERFDYPPFEFNSASECPNDFLRPSSLPPLAKTGFVDHPARFDLDVVEANAILDGRDATFEDYVFPESEGDKASKTFSETCRHIEKDGKSKDEKKSRNSDKSSNKRDKRELLFKAPRKNFEENKKEKTERKSQPEANEDLAKCVIDLFGSVPTLITTSTKSDIARSFLTDENSCPSFLDTPFSVFSDDNDIFDYSKKSDILGKILKEDQNISTKAQKIIEKLVDENMLLRYENGLHKKADFFKQMSGNYMSRPGRLHDDEHASPREKRRHLAIRKKRRAPTKKTGGKGAFSRSSTASLRSKKREKKSLQRLLDSIKTSTSEESDEEKYEASQSESSSEVVVEVLPSSNTEKSRRKEKRSRRVSRSVAAREAAGEQQNPQSVSETVRGDLFSGSQGSFAFDKNPRNVFGTPSASNGSIFDSTETAKPAESIFAQQKPIVQPAFGIQGVPVEESSSKIFNIPSATATPIFGLAENTQPTSLFGASPSSSSPSSVPASNRDKTDVGSENAMVIDNNSNEGGKEKSNGGGVNSSPAQTAIQSFEDGKNVSLFGLTAPSSSGQSTSLFGQNSQFTSSAQTFSDSGASFRGSSESVFSGDKAFGKNDSSRSGKQSIFGQTFDKEEQKTAPTFFAEEKDGRQLKKPRDAFNASQSVFGKPSFDTVQSFSFGAPPQSSQPSKTSWPFQPSEKPLDSEGAMNKPFGASPKPLASFGASDTAAFSFGEGLNKATGSAAPGGKNKAASPWSSASSTPFESSESFFPSGQNSGGLSKMKGQSSGWGEGASLFDKQVTPNTGRYKKIGDAPFSTNFEAPFPSSFPASSTAQNPYSSYFPGKQTGFGDDAPPFNPPDVKVDDEALAASFSKTSPEELANRRIIRGKRRLPQRRD